LRRLCFPTTTLPLIALAIEILAFVVVFGYF
jgi:hypothetical protein